MVLSKLYYPKVVTSEKKTASDLYPFGWLLFFFKEKQLPKAQRKEHCRVSLCFVLLGTLLQPRGRPSSPLLMVLLVADLGQALQLWMSILTISALYVVLRLYMLPSTADSLDFYIG